MEQSPHEKRVIYVTVSDDEAGVRLDNFLAKHLKKVPKTRIYRAIRTGEVRVNKGRAQAATRLMGGESVRIPPISHSMPVGPTFVSPAIQDLLTAAILYEDTQVIVLNKPVGMPVHGGTDQSIGVIESLRLMYPLLKSLELVHRLDKDTSGCLLIAKKRSALRALHEAMRAGEIQKNYQLLVAGHWPKHIQKVTLPLRKFQHQSGERMVVVDEEKGKECETLFKPLVYMQDSTWVEATLITGRTHQIRVHCAQSGYPIIGDEKYGKKTVNADFRAQGLTRMALHAARLKVSCPIIGLELAVEAPTPESLSSMISE
jgi:23S rRNA pseudouridine955/2504/2580 synthase